MQYVIIIKLFLFLASSIGECLHSVLIISSWVNLSILLLILFSDLAIVESSKMFTMFAIRKKVWPRKHVKYCHIVIILKNERAGK